MRRLCLPLLAAAATLDDEALVTAPVTAPVTAFGRPQERPAARRLCFAFGGGEKAAARHATPTAAAVPPAPNAAPVHREHAPHWAPRWAPPPLDLGGSRFRQLCGFGGKAPAAAAAALRRQGDGEPRRPPAAPACASPRPPVAMAVPSGSSSADSSDSSLLTRLRRMSARAWQQPALPSSPHWACHVAAADLAAALAGGAGAAATAAPGTGAAPATPEMPAMPAAPETPAMPAAPVAGPLARGRKSCLVG